MKRLAGIILKKGIPMEMYFMPISYINVMSVDIFIKIGFTARDFSPMLE